MTQVLDTIENKVRKTLQGVDKALLAAVSLASLAGMLLAHGFAFANLFPNHDGTVLVFDAQWTMYVLGRWAQNLYFPLVRGKVAAPWLIGAFSIVYVALSGYGMACLLRLRRAGAALLTAILACCASVTAMLATYTYETDAYLLAMLLACAGVWCAEKHHAGYPGGGYCRHPFASASAWRYTKVISNLRWACFCCCCCKTRWRVRHGASGLRRAGGILLRWRLARGRILLWSRSRWWSPGTSWPIPATAWPS